MARILVIDDDPGLCTLLSDFLSDTVPGHQVRAAYDGEQGLAMAKADPPDVIVLDRNMPGLDGFEVCKRLRSFGPTMEIPVLMLTGENTLPGAMEGLASGADDHITKPFDLDELAARIQALLICGR